MPTGTFVKYSIGGSLLSDKWSINVWQSLAGTPAIPSSSALQAAALDRLNGFATIVWGAASNAIKTQNVPGTTLSTCRAQFFQGGVVAQSSLATITPVAGTSTVALPPYSALCCTLQSPIAGRSNRGRVYLPYTGGGMAVSTLQDGGHTGAIATALALWLSGLGPNDDQFDGDPASHAVIVSGTHGTFQNIVNVRIDSLIDTQRGRGGAFVASTTSNAAITEF